MASTSKALSPVIVRLRLKSPSPLQVRSDILAACKAVKATKCFSSHTSLPSKTGLGRAERHSPTSLSSNMLPRSKRRHASSNAAAPLKRTALYDLHIKHGAKMVPFGGYEMPVQYNDLSIGESHNWTRGKASIFDVGHMVQHFFKGPGAQSLLERLTPAGLSSLPNHQCGLSCFLLPENGGIQDDTIITRIGPQSFYFVTNAACRDSDLAYLEKEIARWRSEGNQDVQWKVLDGHGLIALQGPLAAELLQNLVVDLKEDNLKEMLFGQSKYIRLKLPSSAQSSPVLVSRGGYTGEDGFEISLPAAETEAVVNFLLTTSGPDKLRMAGLGARDSLRLEAGMCLYGHDLDELTTPVEGGLSWIIGQERREQGGFYGSDRILQQLKPKKEGGGVKRRRIGLVVEGAPAREGAEIFDAAGHDIGHVTSGCPSPTMKQNIAMGYVQSGHNKAGTELVVKVRGKPRKAVVTKMPFVPSKYWKGGASPS